jgi:hypothetical protein
VLTYVAYGLGVHSAVELPELVPGPAPPDVVVRLESLPGVPPDHAASGSLVHAAPDEVRLHWPEAGAILVRRGREIIIDPRPGVDPGVLRLYLLGPAFALLLHQRRLLVLHASAVALNGHAAAFLGHSGEGKSTTAAALHARGCPVIADDVVAVHLPPSGTPVALPGFAQLKLWPDAVTALGEAPESLSRVVSAAAAPRPLRRLYVLTDAESLELEPLGGHAAVFQLLQHSYIAAALPGLGSSSHLDQCARLAAAVPVRRLRRPRSLAGLGELGALIEGDVAGRAPAPP